MAAGVQFNKRLCQEGEHRGGTVQWSSIALAEVSRLHTGDQGHRGPHRAEASDTEAICTGFA